MTVRYYKKVAQTEERKWMEASLNVLEAEMFPLITILMGIKLP